MKIFKYVLCIMTLCSQFAWADIVNEDENKNIVVERFLSALKTKDIVEIAKVIEYPFLRKFPIYDIKNEEDFYLKLNLRIGKQLVGEGLCYLRDFFG